MLLSMSSRRRIVGLVALSTVPLLILLLQVEAGATALGNIDTHVIRPAMEAVKGILPIDPLGQARAALALVRA